MKIEDFEKNKNKTTNTRKIKREMEHDLFVNKKRYILVQIDDKTWKYYWLRE